MPRVMIKCPVTGKAAYTYIFMDAGTFNSCQMSNNSFQCAECGQMHTWNKEDAFLEDESAQGASPEGAQPGQADADQLVQAANALVSQGRYAEAEPLVRQLVAIREATVGPDHPDTARSVNSLARALHLDGKYAEAEPLYRRALAILESTAGHDGRPKAGLLDTLRSVFRWPLARPKKTAGPDDGLKARVLNNLASVLQAQGRNDEAEPLFRQAAAIGRAAPSSDDLATALRNYPRTRFTAHGAWGL